MGADILKLGVIGTADIAVNRVIPGLKDSDKVRVHAIASRDGKKATEWAKKLGIELSYGSYEELLDNPHIQAVYIPLPNSLHAEWAIKAMEKGKHVMCEKPLALSSDQVRQMIRVSREKKRILMEAFMYRFHPRHKAVVERVRKGDIGEIRSIETAFTYLLGNPSSYLMSRELGGGALYDVGCYCINVSRLLTGMEPVEVYGTYVLTPTKVDLTFSGILKFPRDIHSLFHVSMNEEPRYYYRVTGEKGLIDVPWAFVSFGKPTHIFVQQNEKEKTVKFQGVDEYKLEFEAFARAIFEGTTLPFNIEDSLKNVYVLEALVKSAQKGKPVRV